MVYRGYLMNRVADLFGRTRLAWILSLVMVSVIFGFAHIYQGVTGVTENAIDGFLLGLMYLRCDRKLSVPIIAHGITDTVDFLLIFLGKYPGM
jgi:membrane protease YdiL (CAAX protease family)